MQLASAILTVLAIGSFAATIAGLTARLWLLAALGLVFVVVPVGVLVLLYRIAVKSVSLATDLYWERAAYRLEAPSDTNVVTQTLEITVRALRDGVERFRNKYWWTGHGKVQLRVLSQHKIEGRPIAREAWRYYTVNLGRKLRAHEPETVIIQNVMTNPGRWEPLLQKTVTEPIGTLILEYVPPPNDIPRDVIEYEYETAFSEHSVHETRKPWTPGRHTWRLTIRNPRMGHTYGIRWGEAQPAVEVRVDE